MPDLCHSARQRRRHWYTDLVLTRSRQATCAGLTSCLNIWAACSRTFLTPGPSLGGQATIGVPHDPGIDHLLAGITPTRRT